MVVGCLNLSLYMSHCRLLRVLDGFGLSELVTVHVSLQTTKSVGWVLAGCGQPELSLYVSLADY